MPWFSRNDTAWLSRSENSATSTLAPVTSLRPDDWTWTAARWTTRWKPAVGSGSLGFWVMMPLRRLSMKVSRSCRRRSISTPQALRTGTASSSSVIASSRCSRVAYSCRRSPASPKARWRDFSRFLDSMDIELPRLERTTLYRLFLLQSALERMLVFARVIHRLRHLGLGDLIGINAAHPHALLMDVKHDLRGFIAILLEDVLQNVDHELHRRVVVVQHQHLVHRRLLGSRPGQRQCTAAPLALAVAIVATRRRLRRTARGLLGPAQPVAVEAPFACVTQRDHRSDHTSKIKATRELYRQPKRFRYLGRSPSFPRVRVHWFAFMWLTGALGSRRSSAGTSLRGGLTGMGTVSQEKSRAANFTFAKPSVG